MRFTDTWVVWAMVLSVCAFAAAPLVGVIKASHVQYVPILGFVTFVLPILVSWLAYRRAQRPRPQLLLTALAVTVFTMGEICFYLALVGFAPGLFRTLSGLFSLTFYLLLLIALTVMAYQQQRRLSWSVTLDSSVGALGAVSVLAIVLGPIVDLTLEVDSSFATTSALIVPLLDVVALAAILGIKASKSLAAGRGWSALVLGLLVFTVSDVALSLRGFRQPGSYTTGTVLDSGWTIGLALIALWAHVSAHASHDRDRRERGSWALAMPMAGAGASLVVLILATQVPISGVAVAVAAATVLLASVRTSMGFHQLRRLGDLRQLARTDELTGLLNRRALYTDVPRRLEGGGHDRHALLMLDLDRFKEVNDSLGHEVGDRLLRRVSRRLSRELRARDILARVGGDEFAILLDGHGQAEAEAVAVTLCAALARPHALEGISVQTGVSIGIAVYPEHGDDLTGLMRRADVAMYKAKESQSGHHVYEEVDDSQGKARLRTLQELRVALAEDQLVVHYQPRIEPSTGRPVGLQALVYWNHPVRGLLRSEEFLTLVDEGGLRAEVSQVVLRMALDECVVLHARGLPLRVAVDLTESTLVDPELPERTSAMLAARGLPASALIVEVTEESLLEDRDRSNRILGRLRARGVRISVADFGTGYSSLTYLRELPLDELKLDRSFIDPMADDTRAEALVGSTIALAHSLGLRIVAEGVSAASVYDLLTGYGCDEVLGSYECGPMAPADLHSWLAGRRMPVLPAL